MGDLTPVFSYFLRLIWYDLFVISYQQKQTQLFNKIESSFKKGESISTIVEPVNNYINDSRICLTAVAFLPKDLQEVVRLKVTEYLKTADQSQYYYLPQSLHLTIQNIRTIQNPPLFNPEDIEKVKMVFRKIIPKYHSFSFEIKDIFELPTSLSLRAYCNETLGDLALELRKSLKGIGVADNKTYASGDIVFGNITVCRYTKNPNTSFFKIVKKLKNIEIGKMNVSTASLITTNSVCYPDKTIIHETFNLQR